MKREKLLQIRLSDHEEKFIKLKMSEFGYTNCSDYVRTSLICPLNRNRKKMQSLLYEVNKIGVNLNQAIHLMHRKGVTDKDLLRSIEITNNLLLELIRVYKTL